MSDYLVKMLVEKVESLEKRISELEKKQSSVTTESDWYDKFIDTVGKYIMRENCRFSSEIQYEIGNITPKLNEDGRGHIKLAVIMMKNEMAAGDHSDHSFEIYWEIKKAGECW